VLAGKSEELIALGALGNLDAVGVGPLLDLAVGPRVEKRVTQALLSGSGGRGGLSVSSLGVLASKTRLAAESGNQGVAVGGLRSGVTALIEPRLDIRVRPRRVEPVARVGSSLAELVGSRLVVLTNGLEERVTLAGLGDGNAILVGEGLELRVGPAVVC